MVYTRLVLVLIAFTFCIQSYANYIGAPLWILTPLTATTLSMPQNSTASVQYQITNQSSRSHTLAMKNIKGVTQITSGTGLCSSMFTLAGKSSCILSLQIDGSQISAGNTYGPVVCEQGSNLQCYRPDSANTLVVNLTNAEYSLGGTISGLMGTVYLQNGADIEAFNSDGPFTFAILLANGSTYNTVVATQPADQTCTVVDGIGSINGENVTNINIICATNAYTVGGIVSGLSGTVTLLNNGGDANTINVNGSFTFSTPIAVGASYNVTVGTQPSGQTCTITNGSGTMGSSNVTNVNVSCTNLDTTLSASLSDLFLQINGSQRTITITNTGSVPAQNLVINYPLWPSGTTAFSDCGSLLNPGDICTITITPGGNATSNCGSGQGNSPTLGVITVGASNVVTSVTTNVAVLTYGCIYQQGYLFAIDDTTANTTSIGGKIASLTNLSSNLQWYNGSYITTNATSLINGTANSSAIITAQGTGSYAASLCANYSIDSSGNAPCSTGICYTNWYLPAICEIGASGGNANCSSGINNMQNGLAGLITGCTGSACLSGNYWSSTEVSNQYSWYQYFSSTLIVQNAAQKNDTNLAVRCIRIMT